MKDNLYPVQERSLSSKFYSETEMKLLSWADSISSVFVYSCERIYNDYFSQSELLTNNFFQFPEKLQISIYSKMLLFAPLCDIESALSLRMRMTKTHTDVRSDPRESPIDWISDPEPLLIYKLRQSFKSSDCKDFDRRVTRFFVNFPNIKTTKRSTDLFEVTAWLLKVVHGGERINAVMERLESASKEYSVSEFITLSEQWDSVKSYPADWALAMIESDTAKTVS